MAGRQYGMGKPSVTRAGKARTINNTSPTCGQTFVDRNLLPVNPLKEQFEPTNASPIRQRAKMGGVS